jgi:hypothetical protein
VRKTVKNLRPPITERFCNVCGCITHFRYDPAIMHSRCVECGNGFATKLGRGGKKKARQVILKEIEDLKASISSIELRRADKQRELQFKISELQNLENA